jgi:seryl-tRNA synthetase
VPLKLSGRKGGETESTPDESPIVVESSITTVEKIEAPETPMGAVFELGATQQAMNDLRSEVAECRAELEQVNARADDLESTLTTALSSLREEIRDSEQTEEAHRETRQASWWEKALGGHHHNSPSTPR